MFKLLQNILCFFRRFTRDVSNEGEQSEDINEDIFILGEYSATGTVALNTIAEQTPLEKEYDKRIEIAAKHIEIINALDTAPEIKNVLIKFENANKIKYQTYKELVQNEDNAALLGHVLRRHERRLTTTTKGDIYNDCQIGDMQILSKLYQMNGGNRQIIDLFNSIEDFIDEKKSTLMIDSEQRFSILPQSTYQVIPYEFRIHDFAKDLETLAADPKKYYNLYGTTVDINNLELYHVPVPNEDFTIYRDTINKLEYVVLYNGKWQVNPYDAGIL